MMCNRSEELERSAENHHKGLKGVISPCSNVPERKRYVESGRKKRSNHE